MWSRPDRDSGGTKFPAFVAAQDGEFPIDKENVHILPSLLVPRLNVTMNILESQVTDLEYLAESPIALTSGSLIDMNGQPPQQQSSSTESPADTGNGSGKKRKSDEDGANNNTNGTTQTRAKRNRYISIAWYASRSSVP